MTRHFLDIGDLTTEELLAVIDRSEHPSPPKVLTGKGMALVFEKPSARTRNSMELAVVQLGGHPVTIRPDEIGMGTREKVEDIARVLAGYHAVMGARVFEHEKLQRMASVSSVPVINMLSELAHPLQALADLLTIRQVLGGFKGQTVAYVGDGNNVCRSLAVAAGMVGMDVHIGCPEGYMPSDSDRELIESACAELLLTSDPLEAVAGAEVVYTDAWFSMGEEAEAAERRSHFHPFQVNSELMAAASPDCIFLHCLPAHRNDEVTDEVLDGPQSRVWQQAENRMHASRGLLSWLLEQ